MVKSLIQLKRELAIEQRRAERLRVKARIKAERKQLRFELARIRNPGFFRAGRAISKGAQSLGRGIVTQAKLIKQQQINQQAEDRKLRMALKKSSVIKKRKPIKKIRKRRKLRVP